MPDIALIAPIVLPLLGAGVLLLLGEGERRRAHDPLPALIAGTVFVALVLLAERGFPRAETLPWAAARILESRPAILIDRSALPFIFGLALLAVAATIVGDNLSGFEWAMALLLWGGSLCFVISANVITLLLSWIVCEAALIGASLLSRNSRLFVYRVAAGSAGVVALVLLTMQTAGLPATDLRTVLADLSPRWLAVLFAVGALRMGLYPLHLTSFDESDASLPPLVLGRLASALAGVYLWWRGLAAVANVLPQTEYLIVWGGLATLVSGLAAWGARNKRAFWPWIVGFELGIVATSLGFARPQLNVLAGLELFNLLLAGSVLGLSLYAIDGVDGRWARGWVRGLSFLAAASLLGLPPTPGFAARWGLYRSAIEVQRIAAILPVVVSSGVLVPALFHAIRSGTRKPARRPSNHAAVGLTVLGLPLALVSAQPLLLTPVLDILTDAASYTIMTNLIRAATSRMSGQVMALIVVPVLAGYSFDRVYERWRARGQLDSISELLSLDWLYDLLASTMLRAAVAVVLLLVFLKLGTTLGWILVVGLLTMLAVLRR